MAVEVETKAVDGSAGFVGYTKIFGFIQRKMGTIEGFLAEEWDDFLCFEEIPFDY